MEKNYRIIALFIPSKTDIIIFEEGDGEQLLAEDRRAGYVDYIDYTMYNAIDMDDYDGGLIMFKELLREKYKSSEEMIPVVLNYIYESQPEYVLLDKDTPAYMPYTLEDIERD